ncbi:hypothetical protein L596_016649 [Steinernema carpocapsae]|uniref:Uncharacterized protein n=1 Tax=Steinernema carpocapsae TaxID=34508 RepID=A0A4V6A3H6_STECR|nr:hypothetical protein L596_016649 [Steinernema carpocapsae]
MKTLFVLAAAVLAVSFACVDKVDNIIKIADLSGGSLNVQFANVLAATYDANGAPACSGSHPDVRIPGQIKLISGQITVKKQMDLVTSSDLKLTVTKDSWLIGTVCKDGEKKNPFVPDGDCQVSLCGEANKFGHGDLCKIIDTPGVHTLENLEGERASTEPSSFPRSRE